MTWPHLLFSLRKCLLLWLLGCVTRLTVVGPIATSPLFSEGHFPVHGGLRFFSYMFVLDTFIGSSIGLILGVIVGTLLFIFPKIIWQHKCVILLNV